MFSTKLMGGGTSTGAINWRIVNICAVIAANRPIARGSGHRPMGPSAATIVVHIRQLVVSFFLYLSIVQLLCTSITFCLYQSFKVTFTFTFTCALFQSLNSNLPVPKLRRCPTQCIYLLYSTWLRCHWPSRFHISEISTPKIFLAASTR